MSARTSQTDSTIEDGHIGNRVFATPRSVSVGFAAASPRLVHTRTHATGNGPFEDLVDVNYSIDENAPLLKFDTETDKRYSVADLKLLIDAGALTPYPQLEEYLRSEGDLPKPKDPEDSEDQPDDQADDEGNDDPTPLRPTARTRIKAAMTVGQRTLRRNPLPHEVKAAVDWGAMEEAWSIVLLHGC